MVVLEQFAPAALVCTVGRSNAPLSVDLNN
jgi:hypothetical protein